MNTQIFDVSDFEVVKTEEYIDIKMSDKTEKALELAAVTLREGGLVAFPTETVYGLGGNAFDPAALRRIFEAKGRPSDNPLIVHIARARDLEKLASKITVKTIKLIDTFWPGPLTVVLPKRPEVPHEATGGLATVAVRWPDDALAAELIRRAGVPVAAPSANLSGRPSPTTGGHVVDDLSGRVDVILKGRDTRVGIESTVIDMTDEIPVILRPGILTKAQIEEIIGPVLIDSALLSENRKKQSEASQDDLVPKSPGMKYTHYAPKAMMTVVEGGTDEKKIKKIRELMIKAENISAGIHTQKTALLLSNELAERFKQAGKTHAPENQVMVYPYGSREHPEEAAQRFFGILRECDSRNVKLIIAEALTEEGVGFAVMNRMLRSAGHHVVSAF